MRITTKQLRALGACQKQLEIFAAEWPDGCEITEANILRALALNLAVDWVMPKILPAHLWDEYDAKTAPLLDEYKAKVAHLIMECVSMMEAQEEAKDE